MMETRDIELLAGIALEDGGISLPLHTVLRKRPFRTTMKIPTTGSLIHVSMRYLRMGVTPDEYDGYDQHQRIRFVFLHGKDISRIIAAGIVRSPILRIILNRPVAWLLRELMTPHELATAWRQILSCTSTSDFGDITRSADAMNKLQRLMMGQPEKENVEKS